MTRPCRSFLFISSCLLLAGLGVSSLADTHYVDINSTSPSAPYTSPATAATVIQDAVNAAAEGDTVMVADGDYDVGGISEYGRRARVVITNDIRLVSVNGPDVTRIVGTRGDLGDFTDNMRCVMMYDGTLAGFTLTNGATEYEGATGDGLGGGAYVPEGRYDEGWKERFGTISNCVFVGCYAGTCGGGAYGGMLHLCKFINNVAKEAGGGTDQALLFDSELEGNHAEMGGGAAFNSLLVGCTLIGNRSDKEGGGAYSCTMTNCFVSRNSAGTDGGGCWGAYCMLVRW